MGPFRVAWSFPYSSLELIVACNEKEKRLAALIDESLSQEQDYENELASYRETLRQAGVRNWATAVLDPTKVGDRVHTSVTSIDRAFKDKQLKAQRDIVEIQKWRRQFEHDRERQPDRTFKLSIEDVNYFEL